MKNNNLILAVIIYTVFILIYIPLIIKPNNGPVRYDWLFNYYTTFGLVYFIGRYILNLDTLCKDFLISIKASFLSYMCLFFFNNHTYFGLYDFFIMWIITYIISGSILISFIIRLSYWFFNKINRY